MTLNDVVGLSLDSRNDKKRRRDISKGSSLHTEHYAYPLVLPFIENAHEETRLLRIAALIASSNAAQDQELSFGAWAAKQKDKVEDRIVRLANLPFEQAVEETHRIINRVEKDQRSGFNWFNLSNTLFFWGKGVTAESIRVRQSILRDFYRVASIEAKEESQ